MSNQSTLKEINPEYSLERWMLKLKSPDTLATRFEEPTHQKRPWERLTAGEGDDRGWDGWVDTNLSKLWEIVKDRKARRGAVHGVTKNMAQLSHWTQQRQINKNSYKDQRAWNVWKYEHSNSENFELKPRMSVITKNVISSDSQLLVES